MFDKRRNAESRMTHRTLCRGGWYPSLVVCNIEKLEFGVLAR